MDVKLHAFPSRDRDFLAFVQAAWAELPEPQSPDALQHALRERYPAAIVTVQEELARHGDGPIIWYAFRTAAIGVPGAGEAPDRRPGRRRRVEPDVAAFAILDDERRFLEVSPALAAIAELPARRMVGHVVEDFSNPADPTIREDIARLWSEFRSGGALASTVRFNYADGRPRELAYRLVADADGPGRHRLSVTVLSPRDDEAAETPPEGQPPR